MSQPNPHVASQFRQIVYYHLDNNNLDNALFVAGRLFAYEPRSQEASHLVALCFLRLGQYKSAYDYSRVSGAKGTNLGCVYVFAQACLALSRYSDGVKALERARTLWGPRNNWNKHSETARQGHPDAAAVWCLLGKLWYGSRDIKRAVECYGESLKLNPFMWDAFTGLCQSGASIKVQNIFKTNPAMLSMLYNPSEQSKTTMPIHEEASQIKAPLQPQKSNSSSFNSTDPFSGPPIKGNGSGLGGSGLFRKLNESTFGGLPSFASSTTSRSKAAESFETPPGQDKESGSGDSATASDSTTVLDPPPAPLRKSRIGQTTQSEGTVDASSRLRNAANRPRSRVQSEEHDSETGNTSTAVQGDRKRNISGQVAPTSNARGLDPVHVPQRRSDRLLNQIRPISSKFTSAAIATSGKEGREMKKAKAIGARGRVGAASSTVGRAISGNNRKAPSDPMDVDSKEQQQQQRPTSISVQADAERTKQLSDEQSRQQEAFHWLLELFKHLGYGHYYQTHYACEYAIKSFSQLPTPQRETPAVLAQIGRAYYEQANYTEAEMYFSKIRAMAPNRLEDMEIYSTVLWHLKNEVELAYLAYELMAIDRHSPQAWCALGNCFSLQRDHDQALKCFKRATQLDPNFAYALTLQGHEHVSNEEYDKAMNAFRSAVASDVRHYNAWYGLGRVYEKMGKYDFAEKHYRTASQINPTNAVLVCCIGIVLEKQKNQQAALDQYSRAIELAPKSALARFKKARLLMGLQEPHRALEELMLLKDIAPDEANVHFLLGRLYKMLRQKANAIKHFTISLNLDPKAGPYIKQSMESLEDDEEDDDGDEHMV